jgi:carbohydrate-binding DOMON domain-containing protein
VISEAAFLAAGSMSAEGIQAFLNGQAGDLKSYSGPDHNGATRTAAQMIAEAASAWGVSPKVIIATLQKEQSLISRAGASQYALDWAMGCGKAESYTISSYKGFGNQVWNGARVLMKNRAGWRAGAMLPIDGSAVYPTNAATYTLYRYTPHFAGATSFWRLYWRYFGDPGK